MVALRLHRIIVVLTLLAALGLPATATAQPSTFIVPFDRTGPPGTEAVITTDPLTGESMTVVVDTGAFVNPCTMENVDVTGASTISTLQTVDRFGTLKVNVSVVTKGTGFGWVATLPPTFTSSTYTFNDSQQFTFRLPVAGEEFSSDFSDKLALRGAKSIDNWVVRAHFRIRINALGEVKVFMIRMNNDTCKG